MKILNIAFNEFKITSRNKATFALVLLMPLFMIFIMGNALQGTFNVSKGIERFQVLYVNEDSGGIGKAFDSFMKNGADKFLDPVTSDLQNAEQKVSSGEYTNAIIVPKDLSYKIANGEKANISVISSGKDKVKDTITESIVDSFTKYTTTNLAVMNGYTKYAAGMDPYEVSEVLASAQSNMSGGFVTSKDAEVNPAKKLSSFQYFTLSMLLFFLMTTGIGIGNSIVNDRESRMYSRISSYPVKPSEYLIAKVLSNIMLAVIQVALVAVFTRFVFNVNWGNNYLGLGLTIVLMMLISSSVGLLFSSLVTTSKAVDSGMTVVIWMIAFLGGGFTPIPALEPIGRFTFYKWGLDSLVNFMGGGSISDVSVNLMMLLATVVVLWTLGLVLYRRRAYHE